MWFVKVVQPVPIVETVNSIAHALDKATNHYKYRNSMRQRTNGKIRIGISLRAKLVFNLCIQTVVKVTIDLH